MPGFSGGRGSDEQLRGVEGVAPAERRSCSNIKCRGSRFGRRAQRTQPERGEAKGKETPQAAAAGGGGVCVCVCAGGRGGGRGGGVGAWGQRGLLLLPPQLVEPTASQHHERECVHSNLATPTVEAPQAEPFPSPVALSQCSEPWNLCFKRCVEVLVVHNNMHGATRRLKLFGLVKFLEFPTRYIGLNHC